MGRFRRGMRLSAQSLRVLRQAPELFVLPVIGFVLFVASFLGMFLVAFGRMPQLEDFEGGRYLVVFPLFLVSGMFSSFANAAVVGASCRLLEGRDATIGDGLRMAWRRFPQLMAWTLLAGVAAMLLQLLAERLKLAGRIMQATLGLAWALATMLVVPVLMFEDIGVVDAVRRSATLVKQRWGEGLSGVGAVGLAMVLLLLPLSVAAGIATIAAPHLVVVWWTLVTGVLIASTGALGGVYTAALYRYAVAGEAAGPFTHEDMQGSFVKKSDTLVGSVTRPSRRLEGWWRWGMAAAFALSGPATLAVLGPLDEGSGDPPAWAGACLAVAFLGWGVAVFVFFTGWRWAPVAGMATGAALALFGVGLQSVGNAGVAVGVVTLGAALLALGAAAWRHARTSCW